MQAKVKQVAAILQLDKFKASNGWLESFRKRHNISFRTLSGEGALLDKGILENCNECFHQILHRYQLHNIWNLNETGLFWSGLPKRRSSIKRRRSQRRQISKRPIAYLSAMFC